MEKVAGTHLELQVNDDWSGPHKNPDLWSGFLYVPPLADFEVCDNGEMKKRTVWGLAIVSIGLLIAVLQWYASIYYLYFLWWWADIVMHFLGGLFIGLSALWWLRFEIPISIRHRIPAFLWALVIVLAVGVSWEIFERVTNSYNAVNYALDTATDLLMDIVGTLASYLVFLRYGKE